MKKRYIVFLIIVIMILSTQTSHGSNQNHGELNESNNKFLGEPITSIIQMINKVNHSILYGYLEKIVSFGTRFTGTENISKAATYINEEFLSFGLDSYIDQWSHKDPFDKNLFTCKNVIATLNGTDPSSDAVFVLTAHLDTKGNSVGANDDSSGVAAILTIAKIINKYQFEHTIKFVIVSGEEIGTLGSFDYVSKAYSRNENIIANLNVDTMGNTTCGHILQIPAPTRSYWLYYYAKDINNKYENYIDMKVQLTGDYPMDCFSFFDYGFDTISFIQPRGFEYPLHSPDDTLDKIVYPYYENATKFILALTAELAYKPIDLQVRFVTPKEGYLYLRNTPLFKLPGTPLTRIFFTRSPTFLIGNSLATVNITTDEEIVSVSYTIDGYTDDRTVILDPPYEWNIQDLWYTKPKLRGIHTLGVHVCTASGKTAYDEMVFFALRPI
jgi:hypothetical protein